MDGKKRVTSYERDAILQLNAAADILSNGALVLRSRLSEDSMKQFAGSVVGIEDAWKEILKSIPEGQLNSLQRDIDGIVYSVGVRRPAVDAGFDKTYGRWVSNEVLYQLIFGCYEHCLTCGYDLQQRRGCRLKKALDEVGNNVEDRDDGDCPYFWMRQNY